MPEEVRESFKLITGTFMTYSPGVLIVTPQSVIEVGWEKEKGTKKKKRKRRKKKKIKELE